MSGAVGGLVAVLIVGGVRLLYSLAYEAVGTTVDEVGLSNYELLTLGAYLFFGLSGLIVLPACLVYIMYRVVMVVGLPNRARLGWGLAFLATTWTASLFLYLALLQPDALEQFVAHYIWPDSRDYVTKVNRYLTLVSRYPWLLSIVATISPLLFTTAVIQRHLNSASQLGESEPGSSARAGMLLFVASILIPVVVAFSAAVNAAPTILTDDSRRTVPENMKSVNAFVTQFVQIPQFPVCLVRDGGQGTEGSMGTEQYVLLGGSNEHYVLLSDSRDRVVRVPAGSSTLLPRARWQSCF